MASDPQTVPLDNAFLETVMYQGREYQRYAVDNGAYFAPIDEDEVERLQMMHVVLSIVFENQLLFPPITRPRRILECGFGAGDWAIEVAQQYPSCEVIAIDICPHIWPDETQTPTNLNLQVDDLNGRFTFPSNHFDLVHSQMMAGGIHSNRWRDYIRDMFRVLRPGVRRPFPGDATLVDRFLRQITLCVGGRGDTWIVCNHTKILEHRYRCRVGCKVRDSTQWKPK
ncbi:UMTA methyltransferase [Colletotrichum incanum]|nr:UMTA methyltransferase [Colletotrichum incanum]